ncbi:MAG: phosphoribosylanthranilate isomerase [Pyrinomonadaceae bacterium]
MTRVKICGITNLEDALHATNCGADELGFNFYKESKRYISPQEAREIVSEIPTKYGRIGVFVNESIDSLLTIAEFVGLDAIQLHGDEDLNYVANLAKNTKRTIIKAFRVTPSFDISEVLDWHCNFQLFDTYSADHYGGTGKRFAQENFLFYINLWLPGSAYVAGGLNPDNVAEAIREANPYAVDVASGVESSPGKKDPEKVAAFIKAAKEAI